MLKPRRTPLSDLVIFPLPTFQGNPAVFFFSSWWCVDVLLLYNTEICFKDSPGLLFLLSFFFTAFSFKQMGCQKKPISSVCFPFGSSAPGPVFSLSMSSNGKIRMKPDSSDSRNCRPISLDSSPPPLLIDAFPLLRYVHVPSFPIEN